VSAARYLDYNAGAPLAEAARAAMRAFLDEQLGNPSSVHGAGRRARARLEAARAQVGALVGAASDAVVLTASGSEAIALGVIGLGRRAVASRRRILVGASEHPAVHGAVEALVREGYERVVLPVDDAGGVRVDAAQALLHPSAAPSVALVAVQAANHETGVVQPVRELAAMTAAAGAFFFCDAVQAAGKLAVDLPALGVSALALSSHKLGGPSGAGALVLARGGDVDALVPGGHQERGRRAGTEPLVALVGFGAAAHAAREPAAEAARVGALRARLEVGLAQLGARIFGREQVRVANTSLHAFAGVPGALLVMALDLAGFEVSTGAACSSGSLKPSAVLLASGHDEATASEAVRVSLGRGVEAADIDALLAALPAILARIRAAHASG
jgi:cysteine desulfurase